MTTARPWYWELSQRGSGPDWHLLATFAPLGAAALADAARRMERMGYTRVPAVARNESLITLIDSAHAAQYIENTKEGAAQRNILIYRLIEIDHTHIHATYAYGWAEEGDALSAVMLDLRAIPGTALDSWQVQAGGEGYDYITVRRGVGWQSFTSYLETPAQ
ncbi:hypothetical protein F8S13_01495 [Chloroflexia bacterium SDU3-3]|nr:hypothetical protein F8S13_01495 [Chloroflexia bacterium SDU3-3]